MICYLSLILEDSYPLLFQVYLLFLSFWWKKFSHTEAWGSRSRFYMMLLEFYANQKSLFCGMSNIHCISALTIKEKNAFKNQNGVTMVQASRMEPGGHYGCGFRHVPTSLRTWIFWTVSDPRTPLAFLKTISAIAAASSNLMVSRSPLVTMRPFRTPANPYF